MASQSTRLRALALYKELHRLGRDYPDPSPPFSPPVIAVENRNLTDPNEIEKAFKLGEYIKNGSSDSLQTRFDVTDSATIPETLALYSLRKYRHLRRMYPDSTSDPTT
ncbi:hypothetical protein MPER_05729 [Moniliophthora perniciosa FA553]|nr:hypothetical protein MPER_05729 [Moniliophthora perniciosa FA553]